MVKASRKPWDQFWAWIAKTEPRVCYGEQGAGGGGGGSAHGDDLECRRVPLLLRAARLWLYWNLHIEVRNVIKPGNKSPLRDLEGSVEAKRVRPPELPPWPFCS